MRPLLTLFKRAEPAAAEPVDIKPVETQQPKPATIRSVLPDAVAAAIDGASMVMRPGDENGPRVVVQFDGCRGFILTDEKAAVALAGIFPDLSTGQISLAVQRTRARAKALLRGIAASDPERISWKDRY